MPTGFIGSPRYMSPEQIQEGYINNINNQTDLFSLDIISYEMLTGEHPFSSNSFSRWTHKVINEDPPPMRRFRAAIPGVLQRFVERALQKDTAKRCIGIE